MKKYIILGLLLLSTGIESVSKQQIRLSIEENVIPAVKEYASQHGVNASIGNGETLFEYAAKKGQLKMVQDLSKNYNISSSSYKKAALAAASKGKVSIVKMLLKKIDTESDKKVVLMAAVKAPVENSRMIKMLLKDANVKVTQDVVQAAQDHNVSTATLKLIKKYYKKESGSTKKAKKKSVK